MTSTPSSSLARTTLIVADVDRTLAFYRLLGFSPVKEIGGPRNPDSALPLAARSTHWRLVILTGSRPDSGRLALLSFTEEAPPVTVPPHDRVGIGDFVFVVEVDDADAVHAALVAAGARVVGPPIGYEMKRPDGTVGRGAIFHVYDPDGRLIEIMAIANPAG